MGFFMKENEHMENIFKKTWYKILGSTIIIVGLTSCSEKGGVIFVENKHTITYSVRISNTSGYSGASMDFSKSISPNKTGYFDIEKDGTYWVLLNGVRYKDISVSVSRGGTAHVTIE
jgi:hypothetical protein